jgi:peptide/nickel transport system substrate-binding protein
MQKLRFYYKYFLTFLARISSKSKYQIVLFAALAAFLGLFVWFGVNFSPSFTKPVIKQGIIGTHTETDLPEMATKLLSTGLVKIDQSGNPQPDLAEKWEATSEGKVYTVTLKQDIYWSDGTPIKTSDFSVPFKEANVEQKIIDDRTIQYTLPDSFAPFPTLLNRQIFKHGTEYLGTGPYKITRLRKDGIFVKELTLDSDDQKLPRVIMRFYPNEKTAKSALKLGEIHALMGVNEPGELSNERIYKVKYHTDYEQLVTIFYNTADPVLSDENLRVALSYAAPAIKDEAEAKTSISPFSWAYNDNIRDYLSNPEQAQATFKKVQNKEKLKETPIALTTTPFLKPIGDQIIEEWKKLGVNAVLRIESGIPQNFQALLITQNIPADPDQYALWHSTQVQTNISKYASPRIDKDLEDGRKISDMEVRKARYQDFQRVLLEDAPATFLFFPKYNILYMKKVESHLQDLINLQFR